MLVISLPERSDHRDTVALTSSLTGFNVDFVDGVDVKTISDKVMPPDLGVGDLKGGAKGAWRAHMNALRDIVAKGYGSALIAEEDFDWDIRLKEQLADFAVASTGVLSQYPPDHVPHHAKVRGEVMEFAELSVWLKSQQKQLRIADSPYGDGWDVLWLGNCNVRMDARNEEWQTLSVIRRGDPTTVPVNQYWSLDWDSPIGVPYRNFPNRTRLYLSQPTDQVCTIAYAVSQQGARKLLLELGLERADKAFDLMLQDFCQGGWKGGLAEPHACWGVMPSLFSSYAAAGPEDRDTDIGTNNVTTIRQVGFSLNIQRSVRINARKLLAGQVDDVVDQYPYTDGTY